MHIKERGSKEFTFLLNCLRPSTNLSKTSFERLDKDALYKLIETHRVIAQIRKNVISICDAETKKIIEEAYIKNKLFQLRQLSELIQIQTRMRQKGVALISLKGPALSQEIYGDPSERNSRDLDLLIHSYDLDTALQVLLELGYENLTKYNTTKQKAAIIHYYHHFELKHPQSAIVVELHWKLSSSREVDIDEQKLWGNTRSITVSGHKLRVLSEENLSTYLCIHGTLHHFFRLQWLMDVFQLYKNLSPEELIAHHKVLCQLKVERYFHVSLLLLTVFFDFEIPESIDAQISSQTRKIARLSERRILENTSLNHKIQRWKVTYRNHLIHYLTNGLKGLGRSIFARNVRPKNWQIYAFPDRVFFLNHLFSRLIWLVGKLK